MLDLERHVLPDTNGGPVGNSRDKIDVTKNTLVTAVDLILTIADKISEDDPELVTFVEPKETKEQEEEGMVTQQLESRAAMVNIALARNLKDLEVLLKI